jgi:hypothetical protein
MIGRSAGVQGPLGSVLEADSGWMSRALLLSRGSSHVTGRSMRDCFRRRSERLESKRC